MKYFSKKALYILIGFSTVFILVFGYNLLFSSKSPVTEKKTSVDSSKSPAKVAEAPLKVDPVNFIDVPLSAVCAYYFDVHKISIQPGQHGDVPISLAGLFLSGRQAKNALVEALAKQDLYLSGVPLRIYKKDPEPIFTPVNWGRSGNQIYIFHGSKLYKVEEYPFLLRRDHFGNFHAALSARPAVYPATAGSAAGLGDKG